MTWLEKEIRSRGDGTEGTGRPRGVLLRTFSRRRSPELMEDNWGKRWIRRSVCVPFPTPGAPTRMIRAAFLSLFVEDMTKVMSFLVEYAQSSSLEKEMCLRAVKLSRLSMNESFGASEWGESWRRELFVKV